MCSRAFHDRVALVCARHVGLALKACYEIVFPTALQQYLNCTNHTLSQPISANITNQLADLWLTDHNNIPPLANASTYTPLPAACPVGVREIALAVVFVFFLVVIICILTCGKISNHQTFPIQHRPNGAFGYYRDTLSLDEPEPEHEHEAESEAAALKTK